MNVDIRLVEIGGKRTNIRIPILPESIAVKFGEGQFIEYNIMGQGTVAIPSGVGLSSVSFESEFPGPNRTDLSMLRGSYQRPRYYVDLINRWRTEHTPVIVRVTGLPITINITMTVAEFNISPAGFMGDIPYEIKFAESRDIIVTAKKIVTQNTSTTSTSNNKRPSITLKTYVVKEGDTLWSIATKTYGSGIPHAASLYTLNKNIIEKKAKEHGKSSSNNGHWIYPGTTIALY